MTISSPGVHAPSGTLFLHGLQVSGDLWIRDTHARQLDLQSASVEQTINIIGGQYDAGVDLDTTKANTGVELRDVYTDGPLTLMHSVIGGLVNVDECTARELNLRYARIDGTLNISNCKAAKITLDSARVEGDLALLGPHDTDARYSAALVSASGVRVHGEARYHNIIADRLSLRDSDYKNDLWIHKCHLATSILLANLSIRHKLIIASCKSPAMDIHENTIDGASYITNNSINNSVRINSSTFTLGLDLCLTPPEHADTDTQPNLDISLSQCQSSNRIFIYDTTCRSLDVASIDAASLDIRGHKCYHDMRFALCRCVSWFIISRGECRSLDVASVEAGHMAYRGINCSRNFVVKLCRAISLEIRGYESSDPDVQFTAFSEIDLDLSISRTVVSRSIRVHAVRVLRYTLIDSIVAHSLELGRLEQSADPIEESQVKNTPTTGTLPSDEPSETLGGMFHRSSDKPRQEGEDERTTTQTFNEHATPKSTAATHQLSSSPSDRADTAPLEPGPDSTAVVTLYPSVETHLLGGVLIQSSKIESTATLLGLRVGHKTRPSREFWDEHENVPAQMRAAGESIVVDNCEIGRSLNIYGRCAAANKLLIRLDPSEDEAEEFIARHMQPLIVNRRINITNTRIGSELDLRDVIIRGREIQNDENNCGMGNSRTNTRRVVPHIRLDGVSTGSHVRMEPVTWALRIITEQEGDPVRSGPDPLRRLGSTDTRNSLVRHPGGGSQSPRILMNAVRCGGDLRLSGVRPSPGFELKDAGFADPCVLRDNTLVPAWRQRSSSVKSNPDPEGLRLPSVDLRNVEVGGDLEFYSPGPESGDPVDIAGHGALRADGAVRIESCRISGKIDARSIQVQGATLLSDVFVKAGLKIDVDEELSKRPRPTRPHDLPGPQAPRPALIWCGLSVRRLHTEGDVDLSYLVAGGLTVTQSKVDGDLLLCTDLGSHSEDNASKANRNGVFAVCDGRLLVEDTTLGGLTFCEGTAVPSEKGTDKGIQHAFHATTTRRLRAFVNPEEQRWNRQIDVRGLDVSTWDFQVAERDNGAYVLRDDGDVNVPRRGLSRFLLLIAGRTRKLPRSREVLLSIERWLIERWEYELAERVRRGMLREGMTRQANDEEFERIGGTSYLRTLSGVVGFFLPPIAVYRLVVEPIGRMVICAAEWAQENLIPSGNATSRPQSSRESASTAMLGWFGYGTPFRYVVWLLVLWLFSGIVVLAPPQNIRPSIEAVESNSSRLVGQTEPQERARSGYAPARSSVVDPWQAPADADWGVREGLLLASHYVLPMIELPVKEEWRPAPHDARSDPTGTKDASSCAAQISGGWRYASLRSVVSPELAMLLVTINAWLIWPLILLSIAGMVRRANLHG